MNIKAKKIMIVFDNGPDDHWSAECRSGISFDEAMRMIPRAWKEHDIPKEPLIKDEKIRKAVRAWAEATGTKSVNYWGHLESCQNDSSIDFQNGLGLEHGDDYTVAELCGEEEE